MGGCCRCSPMAVVLHEVNPCTKRHGCCRCPNAKQKEHKNHKCMSSCYPFAVDSYGRIASEGHILLRHLSGLFAQRGWGGKAKSSPWANAVFLASSREAMLVYGNNACLLPNRIPGSNPLSFTQKWKQTQKLMLGLIQECGNHLTILSQMRICKRSHP